MSEMQEWPPIAVVGAGAVGGILVACLPRAARRLFFGRKHFADAVNSKGLVLDNCKGQERISVTATVEVSAVRDCSVIFFCVSKRHFGVAKQMPLSSTRRDRGLLAEWRR